MLYYLSITGKEEKGL